MSRQPFSFLSTVLRVSALVEFVYFSLSHWFAPALFFTTLGIDVAEVASPFVRSQLQLIGAMVMGYSLINLLVASNPHQHRDVMGIVLFVGAVCIAIFVGHIIAGTLPVLFVFNVVLLAVQILAVALLFPWSTAPTSCRAGPQAPYP